MKDYKKLQKLNIIRKEIGTELSDKEHLSRAEVESILDKVNPHFNKTSISVEEMLTTGVRGWDSQCTVPAHPNLKNINLILALLRHQKSNIPSTHTVVSGDRLEIREAMGAEGMEDPVTDTDCRQTEIWNIAESMNLNVELHLNYDFYHNLGSRNSPFYKMAQSRVTSENIENISGLFERFYTARERQKRPSIGVILDGKLFLGSGWHRALAHRLAQKNGNDSIGPVLIYGNGATEKQKIKFLLESSSISNKDTGDQTAMETMIDVAHQLKQNFNFLCNYDEGFSEFSEKEKLTWAKAWLKENKKKYDPETMETIRTKIANIAFSSNNSQSLPFPAENDHSNMWNKFFPNDIWNPENQTAVIQELVTSNKSNLELGHFRNWKKINSNSRVPKRMWLLSRMGSTKTTSITNIQNVKNERKTTIEYLTECNNNAKLRNSSFPVYDKVVFVKQCDGLEAEAYIWNVQSKSFDKVS